ncbi:MAG: SMP-30/gluconolactonase/LRE family protein, partial [Rhodoferax sp.]
MSDVKVISHSRDRVGECPVWSVAEQALYWVDIEGRHIHRLDWASQTQKTWNTPERVGCIALTEPVEGLHGIVAAMETGIFALKLLAAPEVSSTLIAGITHPLPNMRFNDGRCDALGRFWVSTLCMDMSLAAPVGAVFCLDKPGLVATGLSGMITPNGMAFSPDGATYYLSDSHPNVQKIWTFDFDVQKATLSRRREFADMTHLPGRPDGAAMDVDGCYWICGNDASLVHRFSPQGEWLRSANVPVSKPSMCAFGGPNLDVLCVTSILPGGMAPEQAGLNGAVFALDVGARGLPEPLFTRFP